MVSRPQQEYDHEFDDELVYSVNDPPLPTATAARPSPLPANVTKPATTISSSSSSRPSSARLRQSATPTESKGMASSIGSNNDNDGIGGATLSNGQPYRISSSSASLLNNLSNMIQSTYGRGLNGPPPPAMHGHDVYDNDEPSSEANTNVTGRSRSRPRSATNRERHHDAISTPMTAVTDDFGALRLEEEEAFDLEAERVLITNIDRKSVALQRKGNHMAALELLEQGLVSRRKVYGIDSIEVLDAAEKVALMYNSIAMSLLYQGNKRTWYVTCGY
jgi:hypothetical protein